MHETIAVPNYPLSNAKQCFIKELGKILQMQLSHREKFQFAISQNIQRCLFSNDFQRVSPWLAKVTTKTDSQLICLWVRKKSDFAEMVKLKVTLSNKLSQR